MLKKHLLKISLLLPLMAISATAYAGSTITDKSYRPSEARQSAQNRTVILQSDLSSRTTERRHDCSPRRIRTTMDLPRTIMAVRNILGESHLERKGSRKSIDLRNPFTFVSTKTE